MIANTGRTRSATSILLPFLADAAPHPARCAQTKAYWLSVVAGGARADCEIAQPTARRRGRDRLSCEHEVARLFGYGRDCRVDHCSRNAWQHRGIDDTQTRNAFNVQGFINDRPDTAGADRMVEGI